MSEMSAPRWTHVALPVRDVERSVRFFEELTPLVVVQRTDNDTMRGAWLSNDGQVDTPFVLVLGEFKGDAGAAVGITKDTPLSMLNPWAHLGMEFPSRDEVDAVASTARRLGLDIAWGPVDMGGDVGYTLGIVDPDGNTLEFTHDQKVFARVRALWGTPTGDAPAAAESGA